MKYITLMIILLLTINVAYATNDIPKLVDSLCYSNNGNVRLEAFEKLTKIKSKKDIVIVKAVIKKSGISFENKIDLIMVLYKIDSKKSYWFKCLLELLPKEESGFTILANDNNRIYYIIETLKTEYINTGNNKVLKYLLLYNKFVDDFAVEMFGPIYHDILAHNAVKFITYLCDQPKDTYEGVYSFIINESIEDTIVLQNTLSYLSNKKIRNKSIIKSMKYYIRHYEQ